MAPRDEHHIQMHLGTHERLALAVDCACCLVAFLLHGDWHRLDSLHASVPEKGLEAHETK